MRTSQTEDVYQLETWMETLLCRVSKSGILRFFGPVMKRKIVGLLATLLGISALAFCGNDSDRLIRQLHVADVPVRPLVHESQTPTEAFPESFPLQVALYWSKADENPLPVIHALRAMGIPFFITRDLSQALRHPLVIIYPSVDPTTFRETDISALTHHVQDGGSLFAVNVLAGALKPLFGFRDAVASRRRYQVSFAANSDSILRYLNRPEELTVPLGSRTFSDIFWTNGYTADPAAKVLGRYEDGSAALLVNKTGKGSAYLCGVSFHDSVLRNQVDRDYEAQRHYANAFEPGADVWMLMLRAWYESSTPGAVRLASIPDGQNSVLLLSHDVDWENSFAPALEYARMEAAEHARSTFFIQTKYVSDANSVSFFFGKNVDVLRQLHALGFTLGSHSIIHSRGFNHFDLGSGSETFPSYQPRGTGFASATGATVFGEVRVSKELLDGNIPGQQTIFFRAGHLRVPLSLPEALVRTGYLFDSSFTADDVLTHFPFALPLGVGFEEDSRIYEFPVTFEDEEKPPLLQRVSSALEVIRANAENQAINVLLIHPNQAGDKLAAEQALLRQLPPDVTATDLQSFAQFWRATRRMHWSVQTTSHPKEIKLIIHTEDQVKGITFDFQRSIAHVDGNARLLPDQHRIVLPDLAGQQTYSYDIQYSD